MSKNNGTTEVYKKLGKKYLSSIEDLTPIQFHDFIKLLPKNSLVLDIGCAGGRDSKKFVDNGFKVIGIDLVDDFLAEARELVPEAEFMKMDVCKLLFPDNYFDGIWATAVLLHLKKHEVPQVIQEFKRILKSQGILFIGVKVGRGEEVVVDKLSDGLGRFFSYYSENEIRKLLKNAGFKIVFIKSFPDDAGRDDVRWIRTIAKNTK